MGLKYYHNPRCSKSAQGLEILENSNAQFEIVEYLKEKLDAQEIETLLTLLDNDANYFIRTKEDIFKDLGLKGKELSNQQWAKLIVENPKLLERPILSDGKKAIIGRPPESLLKILS